MENIQETNAYFADILQSLPNRGTLTEAQIQEALAAGNQQNTSVVDVLVSKKLCDKKQIIAWLAEYFVMPAAFPTEGSIPRPAVESMPGEIARKYRVMPVRLEDGVLGLAISDPQRFEVIDNLKLLVEHEIEPMLALPSDIDAALNTYYPVEAALTDSKTLLEQLEEEEKKVGSSDVEVVKHEEEGGDDDAPVIKLVSLVIIEAFKTRASDIHFEPLGNRFRVRYRIDGVLQEVSGPPKRLQSSVISRLKIMSGMSIAEKRLPQDGRIKLNIGDRDIDLRVSSIPIVYGESIVLRILDKSGVVLGLPEMGFSSETQKGFEELIHIPNGIILITGPTGSGKTSTLYSALSILNKPNRKIITVEDPIEYQMSGINQVQVNDVIGRTFSRVLRAMLRQAPNVIMVGEIRDTEVADIAVNASLTGHLVFSTLHTNDAPSSITRLIDMGVKPYLVSSSLAAVLAQRLVRRICPKCRAAATPPPEELEVVRAAGVDLGGIQLTAGQGCSYCSNTGYRGRTAIHELLVVSDPIREMIYSKTDSAAIKKRAIQLGMKTLLHDGLAKVAAGTTTISEILKATQE